jgi:hypothetical protein
MITHFCLRTQEEVSSASNGKKFTRAALISPLLSILVFITTFMAGQPEKKPLLGNEVNSDKKIQHWLLPQEEKVTVIHNQAWLLVVHHVEENLSKWSV